MLYNGTPSARIWIVNGGHTLGVLEIGNVPGMPDSLYKVLNWDTRIYGDFTVHPIERYREGNMQDVRVVSFRHLVFAPY